MKQIINKLKQCLCLMLGLCLLTSSTPIFAQKDPYIQGGKNINLQEIIDDIRLLEIRSYQIGGLQEMILDLEEKIKDPQNLVNYFAERGLNEFDSFQKSIKSATDILGEYYRTAAIINYTVDKGPIDGLLLRYEYVEPYLSEEILELQKLFPDKVVHYHRLFHKDYPNEVLEYEKGINSKYHKIIDIESPVVYYIDESEFEQVKSGIEKFKSNIEEMKRSVQLINQAKAELLRQTYTPLDVMEYAFKKGMLAKEKAGTKLTLQALDADVTVSALVKSVRGYLTQFGTKIKDVKYYPVASLTKEFKGMDIAERTKYVEELTDLEKGSQTFIRDFKELDPYSKRYIGKNITKGFWPLAVLATILTVYTIVNANAENHFNSATKSQRELAEIGKKIEDGTADRAEKWIFFTNPISEKFVETDPVYTLHFVNLASDVYQSEKLLNEMKAAEIKQQKQNVENTFMDNYQKTSDKLAKDLQIGTL